MCATTVDSESPCVMMAMVGMLTYEFQVSLPELAKHTFHGSSEVYGFMTAAMGIGAVIGGLWTAARGSTGIRPLVIAATGFGAVTLLAALGPDPAVGAGGAGPGRLGQRRFPGPGQLDLPAQLGPIHAGPSHGPVGRRVPRVDPIGGPTIGWVIRVSSPDRPPGRRGHLLRRCGRRAPCPRRFMPGGSLVPTRLETFDKATGGPFDSADVEPAQPHEADRSHSRWPSMLKCRTALTFSVETSNCVVPIS